MTVVLAGIGADTTNLGFLGPLYDDGEFEYIPIPEKTRETTETETLGSWDLRDGRTAADLTTSIRPRPIAEEGFSVSGRELETWPFHRDPNFEALTYGEHRPEYVSRLRRLEPGDVVGFYAGLRRPDGERAHRYLIGYFAVDRVDTIDQEMDPKTSRKIFDRHPENAHTHRAVDGEPFLPSKRLVLLSGREPGGLFARDPIRLSEYTTKPGNQRPQYYLRPGVADALDVLEGRENMMFKPAYRCGVDATEFRSWARLRDERA